MKLIDLTEASDMSVLGQPPLADTEIAGLTCDSRRVQPGYLFAALPGSAVDGREFIADAVAKGAVAVLTTPDVNDAEIKVPVLVDEEPRKRYARMAALFFSAQPRTIAAVTGTNGKTSVASFLRQMWQAQGQPAASLGTLGLVAPGFENTPSLTTPDAVDLHKMLFDLSRAGIDYMAMEASSHGLDQYRLDGVKVTLAAFTNLSRDHLDYHGDMESYLKAKMRLFTEIMAEGGTAVINADDDYSARMVNAAKDAGHKVMTYGRMGADIQLIAQKPLSDGQRLTVKVGQDVSTFRLPLTGAFQAENALCALGLFMASGGDAMSGLQALSGLMGVRGRVELIGHHPKVKTPVFVDYAHTPDALETLLTNLRPHAENNLHVVFGCGGDRDQGKRPMMGKIAADLADVVIVTDDNPRSEDAAAIRSQIMETCAGGLEIGDRAAAIATAIKGLRQGDILVVAGKGHEQGQIVGDQVLPFDDAEQIRKALKEIDQ